MQRRHPGSDQDPKDPKWVPGWGPTPILVPHPSHGVSLWLRQTPRTFALANSSIWKVLSQGAPAHLPSVSWEVTSSHSLTTTTRLASRCSLPTPILFSLPNLYLRLPLLMLCPFPPLNYKLHEGKDLICRPVPPAPGPGPATQRGLKGSLPSE